MELLFKLAERCHEKQEAAEVDASWSQSLKRNCRATHVRVISDRETWFSPLKAELLHISTPRKALPEHFIESLRFSDDNDVVVSSAKVADRRTFRLDRTPPLAASTTRTCVCASQRLMIGALELTREPGVESHAWLPRETELDSSDGGVVA